MSDQPGGGPQLLGDRYRLGERVGTGRMTEVFRAEDTTRNTTVAVKILNQDFLEDRAFAERFVNEALTFIDASAGGEDVEHPNYVVMEFVDGKTLEQIIREEGALDPARAAKIAADVCRALSFAHRHGIIHRDVTTANILVAADGTAKLMDVGIARPTSATTASQTAAMLGAATYISPEIARGGEPFARSDLYSLGIVLYEMLTGRPPFTGESPVAVAMQHVRETPKNPTELNPSVPAELEAIVMRALAKSPADRYPNADELRTDLEKLAQPPAPPEAAPAAAKTEEIQTSGAGAETMVFTSPAAGKDRRVNWKILIPGIAVVLLLIAGGVLLFMRSGVVTVPNLVGQNQQQATATLAELDLRVIILQQVSETDPPGTVLAQAPQPNTQVPKGETVTLTIAAAATDVTVPDVVSRTEEDAEQLLTDAGLKVGTISRVTSTSPPGTVISQDPAPGSVVDPGTPVNLEVSAAQEDLTVPNLVCRPVDLAASQLAGSGLQMTIAGQEPNTLCGTGNRIARQDPLPGGTIESGAIITVWTTEGVPTPSPSPGGAVSPGASPSPSPVAAAPSFAPALTSAPTPTGGRHGR
jgi:serine/threonine-protein kinase